MEPCDHTPMDYPLQATVYARALKVHVHEQMQHIHLLHMVSGNGGTLHSVHARSFSFIKTFLYVVGAGGIEHPYKLFGR